MISLVCKARVPGLALDTFANLATSNGYEGRRNSLNHKHSSHHLIDRISRLTPKFSKSAKFAHNQAKLYYYPCGPLWRFYKRSTLFKSFCKSVSWLFRVYVSRIPFRCDTRVYSKKESERNNN